ncbi:MAG: hypothetical protein B7Z45_02375 [Azorhizobium sp. 12-66-6]|nr:MAG: hypothetical protein B7Z45_02375 [Azorhizobium sp. 12-66-6]
MDLPPGSRLSEQEIAARFGVSRQPVREALIGLARMRLVEILPEGVIPAFDGMSFER